MFRYIMIIVCLNGVLIRLHLCFICAFAPSNVRIRPAQVAVLESKLTVVHPHDTHAYTYTHTYTLAACATAI